MEFNAKRTDFASAAQNAIRAVAGKSERPDLTAILIQTAGQLITLSGTDTERGIIARFQGQTELDGQALLPGRYLVDILRRLPADDVALKLDTASGHVHISSGASHFDLLSYPTDNYPDFDFDRENILIRLPAEALRAAINQVSFAAAKDGLRQLLSSVLLSFENEKLRLVATDGHRLAMTDLLDIDPGLSGEYLVPVKNLEEAARLIAGQEEVEIAGTKRQISFQTDNLMLQTRLVEGKYLPYDSIVPSEFSTEAAVVRADLLAALERAELFSADQINAVNLTVNAEGIGLFAQSADVGQVTELVPAEIQGPDLDISFNVRYLLEPLRIIDGEEIRLRFTGPQSAALVNSSTDDNYRYLVMPITTRGQV